MTCGEGGKKKRHGGLIQVITDSTGFLIWTSKVYHGSTHDITAAEDLFPALYLSAHHDVPVLADKAYTGAGIGVYVPFKGKNLCPCNRAYNKALNAKRAPAERANALLKQSFKALQKITICPQRIGQVVAAGFILLTLNRKNK